MEGVAKRFPNLSVSKDVYRVSYYDEKGWATKKQYKLLLENGEKRMRVKTNDKGEIQ